VKESARERRRKDFEAAVRPQVVQRLIREGTLYKGMPGRDARIVMARALEQERRKMAEYGRMYIDGPDSLVGQKVVMSIDPGGESTGIDYFVLADRYVGRVYEHAVDAKDVWDAKLALEDPSVRFVVVDGLRENVTRGNINRIMEEYGVSNFKDPEFLRAEAERMLQRAAILEQVPRIDNFEDGTILYFEKAYQGHNYKYVAVRVVGTWHVSGPKSPNGVFWNELIDFIGIGNLPSARVVTASTSLFDFVKGVAAQQSLVSEEESK
jgi:hypothetical protein